MDGRGRVSSCEDGSSAGPEEPSFSVEEGMRELSIGGGEVYPERPGEPNCGYYVRTGHCKYGARCRYHHPRDRFQFFLKMGYCIYGASCKYTHQNQGGESGPPPLNCRGYPGEKDCSHYLKTGLCKFGINCKFHRSLFHFNANDFTNILSRGAVSAPFQHGGIFNWQASWPALFPGSYAQGPYDSMMYTPGMVPVPNYFPCGQLRFF